MVGRTTRVGFPFLSLKNEVSCVSFGMSSLRRVRMKERFWDSSDTSPELKRTANLIQFHQARRREHDYAQEESRAKSMICAGK